MKKTFALFLALLMVMSSLISFSAAEEATEAAGEKSAAEAVMDGEGNAEALNTEPAQPAESMTRKLSKGTVLYEDEKLKTEIGTLEKDALVILSESGEKSSSVFYAVEVNGEKEVKTAWVKNKALKDTDKVRKEEDPHRRACSCGRAR